MESIVSIIVPIYNAEKTIEDCINSIINQSYKNIEIILVDDGSTDNSVSICKKMQSKDNRIIVYSKKNGGVSSARNYGLNVATGEYIGFVDSDDTINSEFIKTAIDNIKNNNADLFCCNYNEGKKKSKNSKLIKKYINIIKQDYMLLLKIYKGFLWNKIYKKELIEKHTIRLNENITMCEDLLFNFQYLKLCNKVSYSFEKNYNYNINEDGLSKGLTLGWFDILYVYNEIYGEIENFNKKIQDIIILDFLYSIYEAKMRAKIMKIDEKAIWKKYSINAKDIIKKNYNRILKSRYIGIIEKIKLIIFDKLENISIYIKFGKRKKSV